ncbi:hypothetical protein [Asanoa siamensis]|uniref:AAA+ ATPase domain-containing protein n=1 Tax=Asanoa siamensis TaxID=926357 RepID=A0ABQ4CV78_9ACTN|nr:hypothetical protein [Asanoa siamensis]GIF75192.1 hypothetical protein Asi02nite_47100 [Asanoa siamensis]
MTSAAATNRLDSVWRTLPDRAVELAYHAALPVAIDVDLLHLLRVNFLDDLPYEIEARLLLSPLFRELGEGLYEIEPELRTILLTGLNTRFGPDRVRQVALLLESYTEHSLAWDDHPELAYAQRLTALHVIDRARAEAWLASAATGTEADLGGSWHVAMRGHLDTQPDAGATLDDALTAAIGRLSAAPAGGRTAAVRAVGAIGALPGTDPAPAVEALRAVVATGSAQERGQATAALRRLPAREQPEPRPEVADDGLAALIDLFPMPDDETIRYGLRETLTWLLTSNGAVLGLVGPAGSGKTFILRLLEQELPAFLALLPVGHPMRGAGVLSVRQESRRGGRLVVLIDEFEEVGERYIPAGSRFINAAAVLPGYAGPVVELGRLDDDRLRDAMSADLPGITRDDVRRLKTLISSFDVGLVGYVRDPWRSTSAARSAPDEFADRTAHLAVDALAAFVNGFRRGFAVGRDPGQTVNLSLVMALLLGPDHISTVARAIEEIDLDAPLPSPAAGLLGSLSDRRSHQIEEFFLDLADALEDLGETGAAADYQRRGGLVAAYRVPPPAVWDNVPSRNPDFVGHEATLAEINDRLGTAPVIALHGSSGIGKTQVATEFAHRFGDEFDGVWWLDAEGEALDTVLAGRADAIQQSDGMARPLIIVDDARPSDVTGRSTWLLTSTNARQRVHPIEIEFYPADFAHLLPAEVARGCETPQVVDLVAGLMRSRSETLGGLGTFLAEETTWLALESLAEPAHRLMSLIGLQRRRRFPIDVLGSRAAEVRDLVDRGLVRLDDPRAELSITQAVQDAMLSTLARGDVLVAVARGVEADAAADVLPPTVFHIDDDRLNLFTAVGDRIVVVTKPDDAPLGDPRITIGSTIARLKPRHILFVGTAVAPPGSPARLGDVVVSRATDVLTPDPVTYQPDPELLAIAESVQPDEWLPDIRTRLPATGHWPTARIGGTIATDPNAPLRWTGFEWPGALAMAPMDGTEIRVAAHSGVGFLVVRGIAGLPNESTLENWGPYAAEAAARFALAVLRRLS